MSTNYDNMTQKQLRPACKAAGIKYGKMNVTQMREALNVLHSTTGTRSAPMSAVQRLNHRGPIPAGNTKVAPKPRAGTVIENGVRQPGEGTKCRAVWDALDDFADNFAKNEKGPVTVQTARLAAEAEGWNVNNTVIEFYQWRKFHGMTGRVGASK